jgi:hypothetical protein
VDVFDLTPPNPLPERGRFQRAAQIIDCLGDAEQSALRSRNLDYHLLSHMTLPYYYSRAILESCRNNSFAFTTYNVLYVIFSMTRTRQPVLVGLRAVAPNARFFGLDRRDLDHILDVLNWKPQGGLSLYGEALIHLVERLKSFGGNLKKMMDDDPELAKAVTKVCVALWLPSKTGRAHLVLQPVWEHILEPNLTPGQVNRMRPERYAALLFHVGTLNPEWDKLAGPCARCGNYYIKKRLSQKVYCSRRCGNAATSMVRTRERIKAEREDKMNRAKAAIREWTRANTQQEWKRWVSQKTGIDLRFLTRNFTETGGMKSTKKEK